MAVQIKEVDDRTIERSAHSLLKTAARFFADPAIQQEFEEWKKRKEAENNAIHH